MKSNLRKMQDKILKALETQPEILIRPKSHNQLNQIDIALTRIGISGDDEWTPRLAKAVEDSGAYEYSKRDWTILGSFGSNKDSHIQVYVLIYKNKGKLVSGAHNHKCAHETWLEL